MELFDLHADIGYDVMQKRRKGITNILNTYHLEKFKKGGITFVCMASNFEGNETWRDMQDMIIALKEEIALCDEIDLVLHKDDLLEMNGHIKAVLSVEGMCGIHDDAAMKITWLHQQGVRVASLCWNDENDLATGVKGNGEHGLKPLGKEVIEKMIALNMMIDVSHANEKTFWDIMKYQNAIVLASHSNARDFCDHPRNLWKEQMKAILDHQGIIGIVSAPFFVHKKKEKQDISHMIDHIQYVAETIGMEKVAFGLDYMDFYEGYEEVHVKNLCDASYSQNLINGMLKYGLDEIDVAMISLGNALRFFAKHL